jgi:hypothetical protein
MYDIEVDFYTKVDQFHFAKVCIDGLYISGIKVSKSMRSPNQLWIQMPAYKKGKQWKRYIEAANDSPLAQKIYSAIEEKAKPLIMEESVDIQHSDTLMPNRKADVVLDDISDEPIDLNDIPF